MPKENPRRIVCIGADYDGVFELFNVNLLHRLQQMGQKLEPYEIRGRNKLIAKVQEITAGADRVVVFVFSGRQSVAINELNASVETNIGGCCFTNLRIFCRENGYTFCTYLYADKVNGVPLGLNGKAMTDSSYNIDDPTLVCSPHLLKVELFDMFTDIFKKCFPHDHVIQHYLDDDPDPEKRPILKTLADHIRHHKGLQLPPGWEVHLHQFDYYSPTPDGPPTCIDEKPRFSFISQPLKTEIMGLALLFIDVRKALQSRVQFGALTGKYNRPFQDLVDAFERYKKPSCDLDDMNCLLACVEKFDSGSDLARQLRIQIQTMHKQMKPLPSPAKSGGEMKYAGL